MPDQPRRELNEVLKRLSAQELERVPPIQDEDVDRALSAGSEDRKAAEDAVGTATAVPRIQFI
jgi:hypothetical protein